MFSTTGGSKELIKDGINGFLVPVNNANILAERMVDILKIPPEKFYFATRDMLLNYSIENISYKWIDYIKNLSREVYE